MTALTVSTTAATTRPRPLPTLIRKFGRDAALVAGTGLVLACVPLLTLLPGMARRPADRATLAEAVAVFVGAGVLPLVAALCALAVSRTAAPQEDALLSLFPVRPWHVLLARHAVGLAIMTGVFVVFLLACSAPLAQALPVKSLRWMLALIAVTYALTALGGCFGRRGRAVLIGLALACVFAVPVYASSRYLWWRGMEAVVLPAALALVALVAAIAAADLFGEPRGRRRVLRAGATLVAVYLFGAGAGAAWLVFDVRRVPRDVVPHVEPSPAGIGTLIRFDPGSALSWLSDPEGRRTVLAPAVWASAWHPSRDILAFTRATLGGEVPIEWRDAAGRVLAPAQLIEDGAPYPAWMRWYGDRLLVQTYVSKTDRPLFVFDGPGATPRKIPNRNRVLYPLPVLGASGEALLYEAEMSLAASRLFAVDLVGGRLRDAGTFPVPAAKLWRAEASWSPDGQRFAWWADHRSRLAIADLAGQETSVASQVEGRDGGPVWVDARTLVWGEQRGTHLCAVLGRANGDPPAGVLRCFYGRGTLDADVSPDHARVLLRLWDGSVDTNPAVYEHATGRITNLPPGYRYFWAGPQRLMRWKPGDREVVFIDQF